MWYLAINDWPLGRERLVANEKCVPSMITTDILLVGGLKDVVHIILASQCCYDSEGELLLVLDYADAGLPKLKIAPDAPCNPSKTGIDSTKKKLVNFRQDLLRGVLVVLHPTIHDVMVVSSTLESSGVGGMKEYEGLQNLLLALDQTEAVADRLTALSSSSGCGLGEYEEELVRLLLILIHRDPNLDASRVPCHLTSNTSKKARKNLYNCCLLSSRSILLLMNRVRISHLASVVSEKTRKNMCIWCSSSSREDEEELLHLVLIIYQEDTVADYPSAFFSYRLGGTAEDEEELVYLLLNLVHKHHVRDPPSALNRHLDSAV
ncbi:hypothetical protein V5799_019510 [Amblyomma americanum]|uniref:Uncharacterized protein n=1 Tax=Amblyomma americanum TaxID=6943 RepID=A0AAQ4EWK8_AMBAM